ncbi:MAG TPA: DUF5335 family protein [Gammaproteobacteria bacterium]|nr:DUF5335 family protein [Gammaproteobacteria bacterium]
MERTEVARDGWRDFCNEFSRRHGGWQVDISTISTRLLEQDPDAEAAAQRLSHDAAFHGIALEGAAEAPVLTVSAGEPPQHLDHRVGGPRHLWLEKRGVAVRGLRIDDASGQSTLLRFRVPAVPEEVDGVASH